MKLKKNMSNRDILNGLELEIKLENKTSSTCDNYTRDIKELMSYYGDRESICDLSDDDLREYALYLHYKGYAPTTYNGKIAAIRYVYTKVLFREISYKKIPLKRVRKKCKLMPTTEELTEIIKACDDFEIKCMIYLASGSGLRIREIAKLRISDINGKTKEIFVMGKGAKERTTIVSEEVLQELRLYYVKYREKLEDNEYLFARKNHEGHIKSDEIGRRFKKIVRQVGNNNYTIHGLRRYFATAVYMEIKDYEYLSKLMGHEDLKTTRGYVNIYKFEKEIKTPVSRIILESRGIEKDDNTENNK